MYSEKQSKITYFLDGQNKKSLTPTKTLMRDIDIAILSVRPSLCLSVRDVPV